MSDRHPTTPGPDHDHRPITGPAATIAPRWTCINGHDNPAPGPTIPADPGFRYCATEGCQAEAEPRDLTPTLGPDGNPAGPTLRDLIRSGLPLETTAALTIDPAKLMDEIAIRQITGSWEPERRNIDRLVLLAIGYLWPERAGL